jgi:hypothetical protein
MMILFKKKKKKKKKEIKRKEKKINTKASICQSSTTPASVTLLL